MLSTRYTPSGKRKKRRLNWRQIVTVVISLAMIAAFCTFGLRYMLVQEVTPPQPTNSPIPTPEATPVPTPSAIATATSTPTPSPSPTPFATVLEEDSDAGRWLYETEDIRIDIERQQPMDGVVSTVAVITRKSDAPALHTAFADGAYGKNVRARTRDIAASVGAIFAINGDYCGYRSDGIIARGGTLYRNVSTREALCLYADGSLSVVREKEVDADELIAQGLTDSWSFGPILVENGLIPESMSSPVKGNNPRTALGQRADGSYIVVVVDGRLEGYSRGMSITELAQYMLDLGCVTAYNLDGGMTSCMYFNGAVISTPCGTANKERSLSDIIYCAP